MPIYEYQCPKCRREFEELVRGNETVACPECGTTEVRRLMSVPAAHSGATSGSGCPERPRCEASSPCCARGGCPHGG